MQQDLDACHFEGIAPTLAIVSVDCYMQKGEAKRENYCSLLCKVMCYCLTGVGGVIMAEPKRNAFTVEHTQRLAVMQGNSFQRFLHVSISFIPLPP